MKTVTTVSNIELTKEECQVLYDAEILLNEMKSELKHWNLSTKQIEECITSFNGITCNYNVHLTCDPNY